VILVAFDWNEYLALARFLRQCEAENISKEALLRSCVSRAYYSAYKIVYLYAVSHYHFAPREEADDHGALVAHLKTVHMDTFADMLRKLRQWRTDCDYNDNTDNVDFARMADTAIERAQTLLNRFRTNLPS
jgi:hypothetical protein